MSFKNIGLTIVFLLLAGSGGKIQDIENSKQFKKWLNYFVKSDYEISLFKESKVSSDFFTEKGNIDLSIHPEMNLWNKSRTFFLNLQLSYSVIKDEDGKVIVEDESPDSFIDLFNNKLRSGIRIFQYGTAGLVHDVFWVDNEKFVILGEFGEDGCDLDKKRNLGFIDIIDLKSRKIIKYHIKQEFIKQEIDRDIYIADTFSSRLDLF